MKTLPLLRSSIWLGILFLASPFDQKAPAQWLPSPSYNTAVVREFGNQGGSEIVSDDDGGAIVVWNGQVPGSNVSVIAQRIGKDGFKLWKRTGVPVSGVAGAALSPKVTGDNHGGAIVMWLDTRNGDTLLYGQRLDKTGTVLWDITGKSLGTRICREWVGPIVPDGQGGAILIWRDIIEEQLVLRAQRVDSVGDTPWGSEGALVRLQGSDIEWPRAIPDGSGGVIVVWEDIDNADGYHIRAQRLSHEGVRRWGDKGILISSSDVSDHHPSLTTDGNGGAIIVWVTNVEVARAQKLDGDGTLLWDTGGVMVCTSPSIQWYPVICEDRTGGAFVAWVDIRVGYGRYIFSQRLDSNGQMQWSPDGVPICMNGGAGYFPGIVGDGAGGAILVWVDSRSELAGDLYTQRISSEGNVRWLANGVALSTAARDQEQPKMTPDGQGGVIVCWNDSRQISTASDVYAQKIDSAGLLGLGSQTELSVTIGVRDRWNLLSIPVAVRDYMKSTLLPTSVSDAFAYRDGFIGAGVLDNGLGYWTKFSGEGEIDFLGLPLLDEHIVVSEGWNLIGSLSVPISVSQIYSVPPGIQSSQFFAYDGNYLLADSIQPGKGYWVKLNQSGLLILSGTTEPQAGAGALHMINSSELPPPAPVDDELYTTLPHNYGMQQNYPNPFNPLTVIRYSLPITGHATLKLYNVLGQEVLSLVDEVEEAGYKSIKLDGSKLPSGVYFYRLVAGDYIETKKMVLMK